MRPLPTSLLTLALACAYALIVPSTGSAAQPAGPGAFVAPPYLQLGYQPVPGSVAVLWHTADADAPWSVEWRPSTSEGAWIPSSKIESNRVKIAGITPHRVYRTTLTNLEPGKTFRYRVRKGDEVVFQAEAVAPKSADQPYRFVAMGDCGAGTPGQKAIAFQVYRARPDFLFITGDIVYSRGRISEYREKFWPVYNADDISTGAGVPLLRSSLFIAAPGNHDLSTRNLDTYPDAQAYYHYWAQPLNAPVGEEGGAFLPKLVASDANRQAFLKAAGAAYPEMSSFSFDYGNAHWTVLDTDLDWTKKELTDWLKKDLAAAQNATWRFVGFHHPGFNSSKAHFHEQQTRSLAPIFENGNVDVVFTGHVHNYQRSFPLTFKPEGLVTKIPGPAGKIIDVNHVEGTWTLDKSYNGRTITRPKGIVYLVTGAGGQRLYNQEQENDPASWQPFTDKFISKVHTFTVVDVQGKTLTFRQLTTDGREVDQFVLTK